MKSFSAYQSTVGKQVSPTKLLRTALRVEMAEQGFTGASADYFKKLNDETTVWIGVQVLRDRRPLLGLFPQVGFINWKMASFSRRVLNVTTHVNTTLVATLGYLMPEPRQLESHFACDEMEIRKAARGVVQNACGYGMPFMTRYPAAPGSGLAFCS